MTADAVPAVPPGPLVPRQGLFGNPANVQSESAAPTLTSCTGA